MISADELYNKLLEIKQKDNRKRFDSTDLLPFGNVERQMVQLENEGKIERKHDIIGSFYVIE